MAGGVLAAIGYIVRELPLFPSRSPHRDPHPQEPCGWRRPRGVYRLAVGQVAYPLIPSILGTVRDLTGDLRAVLGVCIGLQPLAAMMMAPGSVSKRSSLRKADQNGGGH
jgi:hypothetical protein